jgi:polysaccharide export outer membrane protein
MVLSRGWVFRSLLLLVLAALSGSVGCQNAAPRRERPLIQVPAAGAVPRELDMVNLPEYVIEPPDVLIINAVIRNPKDRKPAEGEDKKPNPAGLDETVRSLPIQPVYGPYAVRPDGTVFLGVYGSVPVAGCTLPQAAQAIRSALARQVDRESTGGIKEESLLVVVDVSEYNSKSYYVITDGGGAGEQVFRFPITGKETVLDALANINGLPEVSSKRNIWVARRTPFANQPQQILPVDWIGLTQHGVTTTNYQIFPGDRVYVKAQRLVTIDRTMARLFSPVERLFGVTLLGTNVYNSIAGRGLGFGGAGTGVR